MDALNSCVEKSIDSIQSKKIQKKQAHCQLAGSHTDKCRKLLGYLEKPPSLWYCTFNANIPPYVSMFSQSVGRTHLISWIFLHDGMCPTKLAGEGHCYAWQIRVLSSLSSNFKCWICANYDINKYTMKEINYKMLIVHVCARELWSTKNIGMKSKWCKRDLNSRPCHLKSQCAQVVPRLTILSHGNQWKVVCGQFS